MLLDPIRFQNGSTTEPEHSTTKPRSVFHSRIRGRRAICIRRSGRKGKSARAVFSDRILCIGSNRCGAMDSGFPVYFLCSLWCWGWSADPVRVLYLVPVSGSGSGGGRGSGKSVGQFADGCMDIPSQPLDTPTDILVLWGMGGAQGVPEKWRGVFWNAAAEISETKNENFVAYSSG